TNRCPWCMCERVRHKTTTTDVQSVNMKSTRANAASACTAPISPRSLFLSSPRAREDAAKKAWLFVARLGKCHHPPPDFTAGSQPPSHKIALSMRLHSPPAQRSSRRDRNARAQGRLQRAVKQIQVLVTGTAHVSTSGINLT